jgi:hypothetical protein
MIESEEQGLRQIPLHADSVRADVVDGELLLYHPQRTMAIYLNAPAAVIWGLCDGERRVGDIIALIEQSYPAAKANVAEGVLQTIAGLYEKQLLVQRTVKIGAARIDCLMGTYGRYEVACEALACFLQQSAISNATLLIYNQHPKPLFFDHPCVRIVNEPGPGRSLRYIRQRMHELARPDAEFIHWWDDDDLYLPWHLQDCLDHIGQSVAWQPASSWFSEGNARFSRHSNVFEGSWMFRADYLKNASVDTHPVYTDHPVIQQSREAGLVARTELGDFASYIYRWANGTAHLSHGVDAASDEQQLENIENWRSSSSDVRADGMLAPADLSFRWRQYLDGIRDEVKPDSLALIRSRLKLEA